MHLKLFSELLIQHVHVALKCEFLCTKHSAAGGHISAALGSNLHDDLRANLNYV
jgi:hypothetical protein